MNERGAGSGVTEQQILQNLVSGWVSVALEYAEGAPDLRAIYVYVSSERGMSFANAYFDQAGDVVMPTKLAAAGASTARASQLQDLLQDDLFAAEGAFEAAGVPAPTEYRVYYQPDTRHLEVDVSREVKYADDPTKTPLDGIGDWLGERAPRLF
jgi:hypothetical protein